MPSQPAGTDEIGVLHAAAHLRRRGLSVVGVPPRCVAALDGGLLVLAAVSTSQAGAPDRALPALRPRAVRLDAVAVLLGERGELVRLEHREGAAASSEGELLIRERLE